MIIVGAKGFAKEVLEIFHLKKKLDNICFYDDINTQDVDYVFNKFPILRSEEEVSIYFKRKNSNKYTIAIGNPHRRYLIFKKFQSLGGQFSSVISPQARIGNYDISIGIGSNILSNAIISNSATIGKGCLIYYNAIITHDCKLGSFVELSPGATLLGRSKIGDYSQIGSNATILPDIKIGKNVLIGAGAVVTSNIPDNSVAVGIPAKIIKQNLPIKF